MCTSFDLCTPLDHGCVTALFNAGPLRLCAKLKDTTNNEKKRSQEMQTLHAGCSKVEPKNFAPLQTPFPGGAGQPKFNQLQMVKPSFVRITILS